MAENILPDMSGNPTSVGDVAVIGEGTPNRMTVSLQILQEIYHELTGKAEEVSKSYTKPFQIEGDDFDQLHHRIIQACEQYNIQSNNCSIKIYHTNDTQDTISSFERFREFHVGAGNATESVLITYNFLILLPKLNQPQSYTLTVRVASRIAIEKQLQDEMVSQIPRIFRIMGGRTGVVTVKYIDYAVARNLLNIVDEWFNSLRKSKVPVYWQFIRRRSDYIPLLTRYVSTFLVSLFIFLSIPRFVPPDATLLQFAQFLLCSSIGLFAIYMFTNHLGRGAEDSIDRCIDLSYINLTPSDKNEIQEAIEKNKKRIWSASLKFLGALSTSIVAKIIASLIIGK